MTSPDATDKPPAPGSVSCKRCGGRNLYPSDDPDYVCCYHCGPVFQGVTQGNPNDLALARCKDCGAGVTRFGTRCKACAGKRSSELQQGRKHAPTQSPIVLSPARHDVVTSKGGTGL